jgi:hypothetical protein
MDCSIESFVSGHRGLIKICGCLLLNHRFRFIGAYHELLKNPDIEKIEVSISAQF